MERTTSVITIADSSGVYRLPVDRIEPTNRSGMLGAALGWRQIAVDVGESGQTWKYPAHPWSGGLRRDRMELQTVYRTANADMTNGVEIVPSPAVVNATVPSGTEVIDAVDFAGYVFLLCGRYVVRVDPSTWAMTTDRDLGASVVGKQLILFGGRMYVLCGQSGYIQERQSDGTWTVSSDVNADYGVVLSDRLYIIDGAVLRSCSAGPLSSANYVTHATVGDSGVAATAMSSYGGTVWVMKENGAFISDASLRFYNQVPQMEAWPNAMNGRNAFAAKGSLFVPTVNGLIEVQRGAARYVGPEQVQRGSYGLLAYCGKEWSGDIYLGCRDGSGDGACVLVMRESTVASQSYWVIHSWALTGVQANPDVLHLTTLPGYPVLIIGYAGSTTVSRIRLGVSGTSSSEDPMYAYSTSWSYESGRFRALDDPTTTSLYTGVVVLGKLAATMWIEADIQVNDGEWIPCLDDLGNVRQYGDGALRVFRFVPRYIEQGNIASVRLRGGLPDGILGANRPVIHGVWVSGIALPLATRAYELSVTIGDRAVTGATATGISMKEYQDLLLRWRNRQELLRVEIPWLYDGWRRMLLIDAQYQDAAAVGGNGAAFSPGTRMGAARLTLIEVDVVHD